MLVLLHEPRPVAALKEVADPGMAAVEGLRVDTVQVAHAAREVRHGRLGEQVVVVSQQAVGEDAPVVALLDLGHRLAEAAAVGVVAEDEPALVPACHDVIDAVLDLEPQWARHAPRLAHTRGADLVSAPAVTHPAQMQRVGPDPCCVTPVATSEP